MAERVMTVAECIRTRSPLAGPALAFMLRAGAQTPERIARLLPQTVQSAGEAFVPALCASPRALARLTRFEGALWLRAFLAADMASLPVRLLFLPRPALGILAAYAGAVLFHRDVAALVLRRDVLAFREAFGEALHLFAVQRAPFFLRDPEALALALLGPAPEHEAAPPGVPALVGRIRAAGLAALASRAAALPPPLDAMLAAKLPEPGVPGSPVFPEESFQRSLDALLRKLLDKEVGHDGLLASAT